MKNEARARISELSRRAADYSRQLKCRSTGAELVLAGALRRARVRFKFQSPVYAQDGHLYIADFKVSTGGDRYFIVEVDGSSHAGREVYDERRSRWLWLNRHAKVIRFTNEQVMRNTGAVIAEIRRFRDVRIAEREAGAILFIPGLYGPVWKKKKKGKGNRRRR